MYNYCEITKKMKILIFGESGQLAQQFKVLLSGNDIVQLGRDRADFLNPASIVSAIEKFKPTHIINTGGYTAVDKAETEREQALKINGEILDNIGVEAKKIDAFVFHFSTDYVFNGNKTSEYNENDAPDPINFYGYSKLVGEQRLVNSGCKSIIFRVSWIYSPTGQNFLKSILRLVQSQTELKVVNDQIGTPTSAIDIAKSVVKITQDPQLFDKCGLYHMAPKGHISWFGFAEKIVKLASLQPEKFKILTGVVLPVASEAYLTPAKRPKNSRLSSEKLKSAFGIELPNWEESLQEVVKIL